MPREPGTTLGPYAVTAKIGEGGMGEVYRARDTKLDRDVALKVLPQAFTDDPDRLARFEREAKVLVGMWRLRSCHKPSRLSVWRPGPPAACKEQGHESSRPERAQEVALESRLYDAFLRFPTLKAKQNAVVSMEAWRRYMPTSASTRVTKALFR